jgi:aspartyl-tRNA(Asn)/glutamyl-tRNA(Gln) amidotransferase subunit C
MTIDSSGSREAERAVRGVDTLASVSEAIVESIYYELRHMAATPIINRELVRKLADLAHLSLTDEECDSFTAEIQKILTYAEQIQSLDTEGVEPTSHALLEAGGGGGETRRDDEPRTGLAREAVLEAAPDDGDGLFKVPRVLP